MELEVSQTEERSAATPQVKFPSLETTILTGVIQVFVIINAACIALQ